MTVYDTWLLQRTNTFLLAKSTLFFGSLRDDNSCFPGKKVFPHDARCQSPQNETSAAPSSSRIIIEDFSWLPRGLRGSHKWFKV
jgi:hypothetical protein